jgi:glycosyltransferase involved in cell wall biosynthesis
LTEQDKKDRSYLKNKFVIPNAVQNPELLISNLSNKRAISVGRLDQFKNFSDQIKTWKKVIKKHPDWTLHIYGEGSERQELQQQIKESALTNHVFLEGNSKNIIERYAESSFFIFTSLAEGFGMVLVEAMQSGLPVISYDCPCGPGDIITDEIDGYLIKVHNVEKLEQRICELIENEDKRKMMGKNAAVKSRRFLPENIMPQWINLFQSLQKNKISIH